MSASAHAALPLVRTENTTRLSEHVYTIPDGDVAGVPNVGIVVGARATLVIDTGMGPRNGALVVDAARGVSGGSPLRLATTHVHPEHDLGAQAFPPDTVLIRARAQVAEIDDVGMSVAEDFRRRSPDFRELLEDAAFRSADIIFDDTLDLDLGGVRVRLRAMGANHTPGDTIAFVPEDGVLFAGDIVMKGAPAFASPRSSLTHWLASLDVLESMDARIIVPSHGPIGDREMIGRYRAYLHRVRERATALRAADADADEAAAVIVEELIGEYRDAGRIEGAARVAYAEAGLPGAETQR